jgi:hypothetical protein
MQSTYSAYPMDFNRHTIIEADRGHLHAQYMISDRFWADLTDPEGTLIAICHHLDQELDDAERDLTDLGRWYDEGGDGYGG